MNIQNRSTTLTEQDLFILTKFIKSILSNYEKLPNPDDQGNTHGCIINLAFTDNTISVMENLLSKLTVDTQLEIFFKK